MTRPFSAELSTVDVQRVPLLLHSVLIVCPSVSDDAAISNVPITIVRFICCVSPNVAMPICLLQPRCRCVSTAKALQRQTLPQWHFRFVERIRSIRHPGVYSYGGNSAPCLRVPSGCHRDSFSQAGNSRPGTKGTGRGLGPSPPGSAARQSMLPAPARAAGMLTASAQSGARLCAPGTVWSDPWRCGGCGMAWPGRFHRPGELIRVWFSPKGLPNCACMLAAC